MAKPKKEKKLKKYTLGNPPVITAEEKRRNAAIGDGTEEGWWNRFDSPKVVEFFD